MQTAACKMAAFSLFSKAFREFGGCVFENCVLGSFSELFYISFSYNKIYYLLCTQKQVSPFYWCIL